MFCDLSSFSSIRAFAQEFLRMQLPLHLLVNAASHSPSRRAPWEPESPITATPEYSNDGYELSFAVGYLGHFLLTELLIPKIRQTAFEEGDQGRIVNVCPINLSTVRPCSTSSGCEEAAERYANARQASLSLALYAGELACRLSNEDTSRRNCPLITINACSPEGNWDRPEAVNSGWGASGCLSALSKSPSRRKHVMSVDAALPPVHLACSSQLRDTSGIYFVGTAPAFVAWSEHSLRESSHDLYESSLHMVGLALEGSPRHSVPLSP
jgi:NAD(P)-dependent dehydrogenase (short-subunit alcohol dehydrogenase family)